MASVNLPIQKYQIHFVHNRNPGTPTTHTRSRRLLLSVVGPDNSLFLGMEIMFTDVAQWISTGQLTKTSAKGYSARAWVPFDEFPVYYDLLRNEQPVLLWIDYGLEPAVTQTTPIINFSLHTGDEPLGEGPADQSGLDLK